LIQYEAGDQGSMWSSQNSLVADSDSDSQPLNDDMSYVIPSPPMSGNSTEARSVDSLVFVDTVKHLRDPS
jgi:hypothetical protein